MKIRILNTEAMGTDGCLKNGDVIEVVEATPNLYREVGRPYIFDKDWTNLHFEIVEEF